MKKRYLLKSIRVINSCQTLDQLKIAKKYTAIFLQNLTSQDQVQHAERIINQAESQKRKALARQGIAHVA